MGKPIVGFSLDDELLKDIDESKSYLPPNCGSASRPPAPQEYYQADDNVDQSSSATSSDDGHEYVEAPDIGHLSEAEAAEQTFLMSGKHKRICRRYTGRPLTGHNGCSKGQRLGRASAQYGQALSNSCLVAWLT